MCLNLRYPSLCFLVCKYHSSARGFHQLRKYLQRVTLLGSHVWDKILLKALVILTYGEY